MEVNTANILKILLLLFQLICLLVGMFTKTKVEIDSKEINDLIVKIIGEPSIKIN